MIVTIIGAERKTGNFQGRDYDNVMIRVVYPSSGEKVEQGMEFGNRVAEYKVKSSILPIEKAYEYYKDSTSLVIYFDQYQNPVLFNPVKK